MPHFFWRSFNGIPAPGQASSTPAAPVQVKSTTHYCVFKYVVREGNSCLKLTAGLHELFYIIHTTLSDSYNRSDNTDFENKEEKYCLKND